MSEVLQHQEDAPIWMQTLFDLCLFGEPDTQLAEHQRRLWNQHFRDASADPAKSRIQLASQAIRSAAAHVGWRMGSGPSTTVAPGFLVILIGVVTICLAASPLFTITSMSVGAGGFAIIAGALLTSEARSTDRSPATRITWALVAAGVALSAADFIMNPIVVTDPLSALGSSIAAVSLCPTAMQKTRSPTSWRRWAILASGIGLLGASNAVGALIYEDQTAARIALALFVVETASAIALLRWALERRPV